MKRRLQKGVAFLLGVSLIAVPLSGAVPAAALPDAGNTNYVSNQGELLEEELNMLPMGAIEAAGWLKEQLLLQKNGLTGAMEYYDNYGPNSGWLGGTGDNWEKDPYYVRGLVALAYVLNDTELKQKAQKWIDWSIGSQREDGYFGPSSNNDWWPRMPMLMAIRDYYEATELAGNPDSRVIPFMEKYFRYEAANLPGRPLESWAKARGGDNLETVYWLYNRVYNPSDPAASKWLLDLATLIRNQTMDWTNLFTNTTAREHVVNTSQALKMPIVYYQQSKSAADRDALEKGLLNISIDHGRIDELPNADEAARDNKPTRGTELCGIVENMLSTEIAMEITGEAWLGDHLEKVAYNSLPAAYAPDYLGHVYYISQNQVLATGGNHEFDCDHGDDLAFGAPAGFECCFPNNHMGWPKFVQNMWMATKEGGLAVVAYGPNKVTAKVADRKTAVFTQDTTYPFDDAIMLDYSGEKATFPLKLRIPSWCKNPVIKVNGVALTGVVNGEFFTVTRPWTSGDRVEITFPMTIETSTWYNDSVAVERGPLIYSLKIEEDWRSLTGNDFRDEKSTPKGGLLNREVYPLSDWNYGLIVDEENPESSFTVEERGVTTNQPYSLDGAPIVLKAKGQLIPEWTLDGNLVGPTPFGRTPYDASLVKDIELVPFGSARLRITQFPKIGEPEATVTSDKPAVSARNGDKIQEFKNVVVPAANEYQLKVSYTGSGTLAFRLNGKAMGNKVFPAGGTLTVENLKSLISDTYLKFTDGHYNNIRFVGNDGVTIQKIEVVPVSRVDAIEISGVTAGRGTITVNTNLTREISPYKILYGTEPGSYSGTVSGFKGASATITGLAPATYYLKAVTSFGGTEVSSSERTVTVTEAASVVITPTPGAPSASFSDDFSDAAASGQKWTKYGNTDQIAVTDGKIVFNKNDNVKTAVNGGENWSDYVVEATVNVDPKVDGNGNAGILFRASQLRSGPDGYNGYYFGISTDGFIVGAADGGWGPIYSQSRSFSSGTDYRLKVLAAGNTMVLYINDEPVYILQDSRHSAGTAGLRSYQQAFRADNVSVRSLTAADLGAMNQAVQPGSFTITGVRANGLIQLQFPNVSGADSYKIEYGTEPGVYTQTISDIRSIWRAADKTSFGRLRNDTAYYIRMTGLNSTGVAVGISDEIVLNPVEYEQAPPTGLQGVAPSSAGGTDGKITGVTAAMEYRPAGASAYTPCTGTEITGLAAGEYKIRYAETEELPASDDTAVTVPDGSDAVTPGDVNRDGKVNALDIMVMRKMMLESRTPTAYELAAGDLDDSGSITAVDIMKLRKLIMEQSS